MDLCVILVFSVLKKKKIVHIFGSKRTLGF